MTIRCQTPVVVVVLLMLLLPGLAYGHRDYEGALLTVQDRQGNPLTVVQHYTDGIVCADPSKLVLYDSDHAVVAETDYYRDVLVYRAADGRLYVFGVGWLCVLFSDAWVLQNRELVPDVAPPVGYAVAAQFHTHWRGYSFSVLVCWAGAYAFARRPRTGRRPRGRSGYLVWPYLWLSLVFMYGQLSVPFILVLAGLGILPFLLWRVVPRRSNVVQPVTESD
jgi:hypothetical protein